MRAEQFPPLATCSITELGFVRVLAQAPAYGFTIAQSRALLLRLKKTSALPLTFIPDGHDISHLPAWVKTPKQTTEATWQRLRERTGRFLRL